MAGRQASGSRDQPYRKLPDGPGHGKKDRGKRGRRRRPGLCIPFLLHGAADCKNAPDLNVSQTVREDLLLERLEKIEDHTGLCLDEMQKKGSD